MTEPLTCQIAIKNSMGLHARPSARVADLASRFDCDIDIELKGDIVNARSIISLLTLAASPGDVLTIRFSGHDQQEAHAAFSSQLDGDL